MADIAETNSGISTLLAIGDLLASSGRFCGMHDKSEGAISPSSGLRLVNITQAEFGVLLLMIGSGGLHGNAGDLTACVRAGMRGWMADLKSD